MLTMDLGRDDSVATAIVLATILVSALCFVFLLHVGIVIAE